MPSMLCATVLLNHSIGILEKNMAAELNWLVEEIEVRKGKKLYYPQRG